MTGIFISYRRQDAAAQASRLRSTLSERYGGGVFLDVEDLPPGASFVDQLRQAVESCDLVLVVIGPQWSTASDAEGRRRLDDPDDFIRTEIAAALRSEQRVVPVLVGGAGMPAPQELPADLAGLARLHAVALGDATWSRDVARLVSFIDSQVAHPAPVTSPPAAPDRSPVTGLPLRRRLVEAFHVVMGRPQAAPAPPVERPGRASADPARAASSPAPTQKAIHAFVSYADEDREIADRAVAALENRSFSCWVAHRDIPPGSPSWSAAIVSAIANSRVLVVLVTGHSVVSKQVLREVTLADAENVPLLPMRLDDAPLTDDFRYFFSSAQWLKVAGLPMPQAIAHLESAVERQMAGGPR